MNNRERTSAILHYRDFDKMPVVHFGYWTETKEKWCAEGHITPTEAAIPDDQTPDIDAISRKLGFDFGWGVCIGGHTNLYPCFEAKVIKTDPDGTEYFYNSDGVVVRHRPGATSIPSEVSHTLVDRESWEKDYKHRLQIIPERLPSLNKADIEKLNKREYPLGINVGSLYGNFRNWAGVVGTSYLYADDEDLYVEIIDTVAKLCLDVSSKVLEYGIDLDYGHMWEDICFKNGPLVIPSVFDEYVGHHYKELSSLLVSHGIDILSLDCDGSIDLLIPTWIKNGVNTMFPIEVGTWEAEISPWREKYGRELRGVGGMDKRVFAADYSAVDKEIERLRRLIDLGGYIPCPDHRIAPDAIWENVQYYCDRMQNLKI